jgi:hypothetical protein
MAEKSDNGKSPLTQGTPRTVLFPTPQSGKLSYNLPQRSIAASVGKSRRVIFWWWARTRRSAHISARQLQVEGKLVGNVQVIGCFEIMPGGQFRGEFKVGELKVHPGAVCEGKGKVLGLADGLAQSPEGPSSP